VTPHSKYRTIIHIKAGTYKWGIYHHILFLFWKKKRRLR
jgi:hypothetical protein